MLNRNALADLRKGQVVEIASGAGLEDSSKIEVTDRENGMYGEMIVFCLAGEWIAGEVSPEDKLLLRLFPTREKARAFLDRRLEQIERMWNGCGCEIDYTSNLDE